MSAPQPVFVMEFNELCPPLIEKWMAEGRLPNFAALARRSDRFITTADAGEGINLEPWIQWYSTHTGLTWEQHGVFHLTDGPRADHLDVYRAAMDAGLRVTCFASMNVRPFARPGSVFVGDPWSENGDAFPQELNIYNAFISRNVREYSNALKQPTLADQANFLKFMALSGLSVDTVSRIVAQLVREKIEDKRLSFRRVALLDALQYDVFAHYCDRLRPSLATFFVNSTAHLQHSYWRHMDPEPFTIRPSQEEVAVYGDAIRFGYESMDGIVGRFTALARRHGARLVFMTALSQQPFLKHEHKEGQNFYRLHDVERFLASIGVAYVDVNPTMTHQFLATFATAEDETMARARLEMFELEDGRRLFGFGQKSIEGLYFGCELSGRVQPDAVVRDRASNRALAFGDILYRIDAIKSGRHHPDGMLWIEGGDGTVREAKTSILDVMPTLLDMLGVAMPDGPYLGRSLKNGIAATPRQPLRRQAA